MQQHRGKKRNGPRSKGQIVVNRRVKAQNQTHYSHATIWNVFPELNKTLFSVFHVLQRGWKVLIFSFAPSTQQRQQLKRANKLHITPYLIPLLVVVILLLDYVRPDNALIRNEIFHLGNFSRLFGPGRLLQGGGNPMKHSRCKYGIVGFTLDGVWLLLYGGRPWQTHGLIVKSPTSFLNSH